METKELPPRLLQRPMLPLIGLNRGRVNVTLTTLFTSNSRLEFIFRMHISKRIMCESFKDENTRIMINKGIRPISVLKI